MIESALDNPILRTILFGILVKRLGGQVKIEQQDIDEIAYNRLNEHVNSDGSLEFELVMRRPQS